MAVRSSIFYGEVVSFKMLQVKLISWHPVYGTAKIQVILSLLPVTIASILCSNPLHWGV